MKYELLKTVYDCFYIPLELSAAKQEIEDCHQALIDRLEKPERKLVLQIIDAKDRVAEDISIDSFISGCAATARNGRENTRANPSPRRKHRRAVRCGTQNQRPRRNHRQRKERLRSRNRNYLKKSSASQSLYLRKHPQLPNPHRCWSQNPLPLRNQRPPRYKQIRTCGPATWRM